MGKRFVLIGHPLGHSVSPAIHAAAYRALGVQHEYALADCPTEADVRAQVERLRRGEISGANVTVPYKRLAFELADRVEASARDTGVANVLSRHGREVAASNTDTSALAEELAADCPRPGSAVILGTGGAAQAAVVACRILDVSRLVVTGRRFQAHSRIEDWPRRGTFESLGATCAAWPELDSSGTRLELDPRSELFVALKEADVVVQATSAGMHGVGGGEAVSDWLPWAELPRGAVAYDVVYNPRVTPFLERASQAGVTARGGLGMLVRQAALAVRIWLGSTPDLAALRSAAEAVLGSRAGAGESTEA